MTSAEKSASPWLDNAALGDDETRVRLLAQHAFTDVPGTKLTLIHLAIVVKLQLELLRLVFWFYFRVLALLRRKLSSEEMTLSQSNHPVLQNRHCGYAVSTAESGAHSSTTYVQVAVAGSLSL